MRKLHLLSCLALGPLLALTGCLEEEVARKPLPVAMTSDALGHFCQMNVAEHPGPKAQAFVRGLDQPIWFPSVRDMLTFKRLPEETDEIMALYVSDTAAAPSFDQIAPDAWIDAERAFFVIGSARRGGMGLDEAVPFADRGQAETFAKTYSGRVVGMSEIGDAWIFAGRDASREAGS